MAPAKPPFGCCSDGREESRRPSSDACTERNGTTTTTTTHIARRQRAREYEETERVLKLPLGVQRSHTRQASNTRSLTHTYQSTDDQQEAQQQHRELHLSVCAGVGRLVCVWREEEGEEERESERRYTHKTAEDPTRKHLRPRRSPRRATWRPHGLAQTSPRRTLTFVPRSFSCVDLFRSLHTSASKASNNCSRVFVCLAAEMAGLDDVTSFLATPVGWGSVLVAFVVILLVFKFRTC